ncbi:unnamed protein product [Polarella glacialis]|nr:unnamed protein product [Polarella glacialis]
MSPTLHQLYLFLAAAQFHGSPAPWTVIGRQVLTALFSQLEPKDFAACPMAAVIQAVLKVLWTGAANVMELLLSVWPTEAIRILQEWSLQDMLESGWPIFDLLSVLAVKLRAADPNATESACDAFQGGASSEVVLRRALFGPNGEVQYPQHYDYYHSEDRQRPNQLVQEFLVATSRYEAEGQGQSCPLAEATQLLVAVSAYERNAPGVRGLSLATVTLVHAADKRLRKLWLRNETDGSFSGLPEHFVDTLFSGWKLFPVLGSMQRRFFGEAGCPDGFAMRTLTLPPTWLCGNLPLFKLASGVEWRGPSYGNELWEAGYVVDCEELLSMLQSSSGRNGCALIDVGANVGACAIRAASAGYRVLAVEADPDNFRWLQMHRELNGPGVRHRMSVVHAAAAAKAGFVQFLEVKSNRALSLVLPAGRRAAEAMNATSWWAPLTKRDVHTATIPAMTIDGILEGHGFPLDPLEGHTAGQHRAGECYVLKVDIEGSEVEALAGASRLLVSGRVVGMMVEQNNELLRLRGESPASLRAAMSAARGLIVREAATTKSVQCDTEEDGNCILNLIGIDDRLFWDQQMI